MKNKRARAVLAASTGGHLAQLHRLLPHLDIADDPLWITFENAQSKSLLKDEKHVMYLPYIASRDWRTAGRTFKQIRKELRRQPYDLVFSTGAAIAVPVFLAAATTGISRYYLESVSRFDGPSLTGKIVAKIPGTQLYTQHSGWANNRWRLGPSVLDEYYLVPENKSQKDRLKIFVTLGTIKPYRFDRAIDAILANFGAHEIVWQLGATSRTDITGYSTEMMDAAEFDFHVETSDVVITHAGVGSALRIMDLGKTPVLVTRHKAYGEHVDDHQEQITRELTRRGLGYELELANVNPGVLGSAMVSKPVLGLPTKEYDLQATN
ncbi:glycosyltransferase [Arthrobacter sp. NPDC097144]|uniref:glycosyltransferase n=1 Tax=Arthrobacter sp. NPDC097144 TaxID=3363946 RepID=UPI0037FB79A7